LATGTGIAPIKSILEQFESNPALIANKTIEVYWGNRDPEDFYWYPKFDAITVSFNLILSKEAHEWAGKIGYVQDAAILSNPNLNDTVVYASGSPAMINCAKSLFTNKGLKADCFFSDAFYNS
jgi:CDP-4-dehydro-6-deoxyglucose reductase